MKFSSLENCDFETLFRGFERAFVDYEIHFEKEEVRSMLQRRGYNPNLSFAFFDCGEIVSFTLNGIGTFNNIPTAYDTGTGTVKEYRGQRLAGEIFTRSIPLLKDAGIEQYLLEVLHDNHKAITIYRNLGFETIRELDCFRRTIYNGKFRTDNDAEKSDYTIELIDFTSVAHAQSFHDFNPAWQNSLESIERGQKDLTMLGAFIKNTLAGYSVFDPTTGDLTQIAVKREFRRQGIATQLLHNTITRLKADYIKVLNVNSTDDTLHKFLKRRNIILSTKQLEMRLNIGKFQQVQPSSLE